MIAVLKRLASIRLTLLWMALLGIGAALSYDNPVDTPVWVLVVPLALLGVNLLAAIITNTRINRRGGLLIFHVALLGIVVLAAFGRLTHMEAHIELVDGMGFMPERLINVRQGPLHSGRLDQVHFIQGPYTVEYRPGMVRGLTHSHVLIPDGAGGWERKVVGDDRPLILEGYRFYTTFNKGFAAVLTWMPDGGQPETGTIHMPSYPLFEFRQANRWTPAGASEEIKFWLQLETGIDPEGAWVLDARKSRGTLVVRTGGRRVELQPGGTVRLEHGVLRYDGLSSWMGYKLYYDPTLQWLFITSMLGVLGLGIHFWKKFANHPWPQPDDGGKRSERDASRGGKAIIEEGRVI